MHLVLKKVSIVSICLVYNVIPSKTGMAKVCLKFYSPFLRIFPTFF